MYALRQSKQTLLLLRLKRFGKNISLAARRINKYKNSHFSWTKKSGRSESAKRSTPALAAVVHVVAPYTSRIAKYDSTVWVRTLKALQESGQEDQATYVRAFLLALALCNAPPAPLDIIPESFELIYRKAEKDQLRDNAWMIVELFVPELKWLKNWDKCERMSRALLSAFMRYSWPAREINNRIKDVERRQYILNRANKVDAKHYFRSL